MSQAMLMRIIALEQKADAAERRMERLESVLDAHFHANEPSFEEEPVVNVSEKPSMVSWSRIHDPQDFSPLIPTDSPAERFWLEQHGVGWYRVFSPDGEITEKGLRKHEAQALADDLNEQVVSQTA